MPSQVFMNWLLDLNTRFLQGEHLRICLYNQSKPSKNYTHFQKHNRDHISHFKKLFSLWPLLMVQGSWHRSIPDVTTRGSSQWFSVPERKWLSSPWKLTEKTWLGRCLLTNLSIFLLTCQEQSLNTFSLFNASTWDLRSIAWLNLGHLILDISVSWELALHFTRWILELDGVDGSTLGISLIPLI